VLRGHCRSAGSPADSTLDAFDTHQPLNSATRQVTRLASELTTDLASNVDVENLNPDLLDLGLQRLIGGPNSTGRPDQPGNPCVQTKPKGRSVAGGRPRRPRSRRGVRRGSPPSLACAVELCKSRRLTKSLIGPVHLPVLSLQRLEPLTIRCSLPHILVSHTQTAAPSDAASPAHS